MTYQLESTKSVRIKFSIYNSNRGGEKAFVERGVVLEFLQEYFSSFLREKKIKLSVKSAISRQNLPVLLCIFIYFFGAKHFAQF